MKNARNIKQAIRALKAFAPIADMAAMIDPNGGNYQYALVQYALKSLRKCWKNVFEEKDGVKLIIISIEGMLRPGKWLTYSPAQVERLIDTLYDCMDGKLDDLNVALQRLAKLKENGLDLYPIDSKNLYPSIPKKD